MVNFISLLGPMCNCFASRGWELVNDILCIVIQPLSPLLGAVNKINIPKLQNLYQFLLLTDNFPSWISYIEEELQ